MAEITAGDIRNGVTFEYDSKVFQVLEFLHVKPGKGAAFVRVKMKDVKNSCYHRKEKDAVSLQE